MSALGQYGHLFLFFTPIALIINSLFLHRFKIATRYISLFILATFIIVLGLIYLQQDLYIVINNSLERLGFEFQGVLYKAKLTNQNIQYIIQASMIFFIINIYFGVGSTSKVKINSLYYLLFSTLVLTFLSEYIVSFILFLILSTSLYLISRMTFIKSTNKDFILLKYKLGLLFIVSNFVLVLISKYFYLNNQFLTTENLGSYIHLINSNSYLTPLITLSGLLFIYFLWPKPSGSSCKDKQLYELLNDAMFMLVTIFLCQNVLSKFILNLVSDWDFELLLLLVFLIIVTNLIIQNTFKSIDIIYKLLGYQFFMSILYISLSEVMLFPPSIYVFNSIIVPITIYLQGTSLKESRCNLFFMYFITFLLVLFAFSLTSFFKDEIFSNLNILMNISYILGLLFVLILFQKLLVSTHLYKIIKKSDSYVSRSGFVISVLIFIINIMIYSGVFF